MEERQEPQRRFQKSADSLAKTIIKYSLLAWVCITVCTGLFYLLYLAFIFYIIHLFSS